MNDLNDPYGTRRSSIYHHAGFRMGAFGGAIVVGLHIFLLLINRGENNGDTLAWLLQLIVYFFIAGNAAEQHHSAQRDDIDHLRGVQAAGTGAALVTSIIVWIYIILRGVFRDAFGIIVIVEPVSLFFFIMFDILVALGIGTLGGHQVVKKYRGSINF
jgi:hypothetical protein